MNFRPFDAQKDYDVLLAWWKGHGSLPVPSEILPDGWVAYNAGRDVAMSFLYFHRGKIGVIEFTTTNPDVGMSRDLIDGVKGLYAHLEAIAKAADCAAILSFVRPKGSEERIMAKMGYVTSDPDPGHRLYAKPLNAPEFKVPEGGVVTCP